MKVHKSQYKINCVYNKYVYMCVYNYNIIHISITASTLHCYILYTISLLLSVPDISYIC